jgi:hypothetical protein
MSTKATDTTSFIQKASAIHENKYDYSLVDYINSSTPITIVCPIHGAFIQKPNIHIRGCGCNICAKTKIQEHGIQNRVTTEHIISRFKQVHGDRYDYSLVNYIKDGVKVVIICKKHGVFHQNPANHYSGKGCYRCGRENTGAKKKTSQAAFVEKAEIVHTNKYDYSQVKYTKSTVKVDILCKKHGVFQMTPGNHLQGYGCPRCGHRISNGEQEWLDFCAVPDTPETRQVIVYVGGSRYTVDGFDPRTNTIYEYNGDYWHGNPLKHHPCDINKHAKKTFGQLYEETIAKKQKLTDAGYTVVDIWASEWLQTQKLLNNSERPDLFV